MSADFINMLRANILNWRAIHPVLKTPEGQSLSHKLYGTLEQVYPRLVEYNQQGFGIYAVLNPGGDKDAQITHARVAFVDCDHMAGYPNWDALPIRPHMICGRGPDSYHLFWMIQDEPDLEAWSRLQYKLALWFNSDRSVHNPSRVMRVPGFINTKPEANGAMHVMQWRDEQATPISARQLWDAHPLTPEQQNELDAFVLKKAGAQVLTDGTDLADRPERRSQFLSYLQKRDGVTEGGRNNAAYAVAAQGLDFGLPHDVIFEMIRDHWNIKNVPPIADHELRTTVNNAFNHKQNASGSKALDKLLGIPLPPLPAGAVSLDQLPPLPGMAAPAPEPLPPIGLPGLPPLPPLGAPTLPPPVMVSNPAIDAAIAAQPGNYVAKMPEVNMATFVRGRTNKNRLLITKDGDVYFYTGNCYTKFNRRKLQGEIDREMAYVQTTQSDMNSVGDRTQNFLMVNKDFDVNGLHRVRWDANGYPWLDEVPRGEIMLFENGYLDIKDNVFKEYDATLFNTGVGTTIYEEGAECPTWMNAINTMFEHDEDMIRQLREFMAACIFHQQLPRTLACFIGKTGTGKSMITEVLARLMGPYYKPAQFYQVTDNGHNSQILDSGLAAIIEGNTADEKTCIGVRDFIKSATGGDSMASRALFNSGKTVKMRGNLMMICNEFPQGLRDDTGAIYDRLLTFPFTHIFDNPDPAVAIKVQEEVSGILNWLMPMREIVCVKGFKIRSSERGRQYAEDQIKPVTCPLSGFGETMVVESEGSYLTINQMRELFDAWCKLYGIYERFNINALLQSLDSSFKGVTMDKRRHRIMNIAVRRDEKAEPAPGGVPVSASPALNLPDISKLDLPAHVTSWRHDVPIELLATLPLPPLPAGAIPLSR